MFKLSFLARTAVLLALFVITFGAYTRLKDAGLGCPDWPGCYGKIVVSSDTIEPHKAWIEMIHRYVAGTLGILILYLTYKIRNTGKAFFVGCVCILLVIFQALLGMWTVTLKLYPVVVMGHLLGGFSILGCLWVIELLLSPDRGRFLYSMQGKGLINMFVFFSLIFLIIQISLGGWTSATYSALACNGFPECNQSYWPANMNFKDAFDLFKVGLGKHPTQIEHSIQVAIQMSHRIGALITTITLLITSYLLIFTNRLNVMHQLGYRLFMLISLQFALGIANVLVGLPIYVSVAHTFVAALLFMTLISIILRLNGQVNRT